MKQEFSLNSKKSHEFMEYFNSALRNPEHGMIEGDASGKYSKNGEYIIERSAQFEYKSRKLFVIWKIVMSPDGTLLSIENTNNTEHAEFNILISQFINEILQDVISNKRSKFFKRNYYSVISGCNLPGEYWLPGFRFAPLFESDESSLVNAERIVVIDHEVEAIDNRHAEIIAENNAAIYSAYLSFLLDISLIKPKYEMRYFLKRDDNDLKMVRESTQLVDTNRISSMPKKKEICKLGTFKNSVYDKMRFFNETLVCPIETRKIIRGIKEANIETFEAFNRCCLMYQLANNIGYEYPTAKLSYECAAVESIVKTLKYKSFTDFMMKYAGEHRELYEFIYGRVRSGHWHSGDFILGEFDFSTDIISDPSFMQRNDLLRKCHYLIRVGILNWLNETIQFDLDRLEESENT